jgi:hypothetical protein
MLVSWGAEQTVAALVVVDNKAMDAAKVVV